MGAITPSFIGPFVRGLPGGAITEVALGAGLVLGGFKMHSHNAIASGALYGIGAGLLIDGAFALVGHGK